VYIRKSNLRNLTRETSQFWSYDDLVGNQRKIKSNFNYTFLNYGVENTLKKSIAERIYLLALINHLKIKKATFF
jgi:hypothetical protein